MAAAGRARWLRGWQHRVVAAAIFSFLSTAALASGQNIFPPSGNIGIGTTSPQTFHFPGLGIFGAMPGMAWKETDAGANSQWWDMYIDSGVLSFRILSDDLTLNSTWLQVIRSGASISSVSFPGGSIGVGGIPTNWHSPGLHIIGQLPGLAWRDNHATANNRYYDIYADSGTLYHRVLDDTGTAATSWLELNRAGATVGTVAFPNGTVGVGTRTPNTSVKLHVAGNAQVDGNLAAKYQDVAEWVPARPGLVDGTVLVVDRDKVNHVLPAATPYDTGVAGVVSAQPGIVLGEPGNDKVMVTHNGRVRVKVDAQYGAIAVGDLLVTSPTPGHAMRSIPVNLGGVEIHRPGTILGKALESIENGQGEILVLLTLQ